MKLESNPRDRWALVLVLGVVSSAGAQQLDARWAPFAGCWELVDGGATSCVRPVNGRCGDADDDAWTASRCSNRRSSPTARLTRSLSQTAPGRSAHEWSRDGRKLFGRAELRCASQPVRTVTGLSLMTGDNSWLDVQAIEIAGSTSLRLRRYRRAAGNRPAPADVRSRRISARQRSPSKTSRKHTPRSLRRCSRRRWPKPARGSRCARATSSRSMMPACRAT